MSICRVTSVLFVFLTLQLVGENLYGQSETVEQIIPFEGIRLEKENKSAFLSIGGKIKLKTGSGKYKGILDTVQSDCLSVGINTIQLTEIEYVKFISPKKKKSAKIMLISAPVSFGVALGFGFWYLGTGGEWTNYTAIGFLSYVPIAILTGVILLKKKKYKLDKGWKLKVC